MTSPNDLGIFTSLSKASIVVSSLIGEVEGRARKKFVAKLSEKSAGSESLALYGEMLRRINSGEDVSDLAPYVRKHIAGQEQRDRLFSGLIQSHGNERLSRLLEARARVENAMLSALENPDIPTSEAMAILEYLNEQIPAAEKKITAGSDAMSDVAQALGKIAEVEEVKPSRINNLIKGTTPLGRDIVRKAAFAVIRGLSEERS